MTINKLHNPRNYLADSAREEYSEFVDRLQRYGDKVEDKRGNLLDNYVVCMFVTKREVLLTFDKYLDLKYGKNTFKDFLESLGCRSQHQYHKILKRLGDDGSILVDNLVKLDNGGRHSICEVAFRKDKLPLITGTKRR